MTLRKTGIEAAKNELNELKDLLGVVGNKDGTLAMAFSAYGKPMTLIDQNGGGTRLTLDSQGYVVSEKLRER